VNNAPHLSHPYIPYILLPLLPYSQLPISQPDPLITQSRPLQPPPQRPQAKIITIVTITIIAVKIMTILHIHIPKEVEINIDIIVIHLITNIEVEKEVVKHIGKKRKNQKNLKNRKKKKKKVTKLLRITNSNGLSHRVRLCVVVHLWSQVIGKAHWKHSRCITVWHNKTNPKPNQTKPIQTYTSPISTLPLHYTFGEKGQTTWGGDTNKGTKKGWWK